MAGSTEAMSGNRICRVVQTAASVGCGTRGGISREKRGGWMERRILLLQPWILLLPPSNLTTTGHCRRVEKRIARVAVEVGAAWYPREEVGIEVAVNLCMTRWRGEGDDSMVAAAGLDWGKR